MGRVLVVGDAMVDIAFHGSVNRISPEAPVPVLLNPVESASLGGAANVAAGLRVLGHQVDLFCIVGADSGADILLKLCEKVGINLFSYVADIPTTQKKRFLCNGHQLLRVDSEMNVCTDIGNNFADFVLNHNLYDYDVIVVSDYNKGSIQNPNLVESLSRYAPVVVDPKKSDWRIYSGAYFITPNSSESLAACEFSHLSEPELLENCNITYGLFTKGADGMRLYHAGHLVKSCSAISKSVVDVTGAGDTVVVYIAAAICEGLSPVQGVIRANAAASVTVSKLGVYSPLLDELPFTNKENPSQLDFRTIPSLPKDKKIVFTNGCFDIIHKGHVEYLRKSKNLGDFLIVGVNSDASVAALKGPGRPVNCEFDRCLILSHFSFIDAVVLFDENTPENLIHLLSPNVLTKGADYDVSEVVGADYVLSNGGVVELIGLEDGYSTTSIIKKVSDC